MTIKIKPFLSATFALAIMTLLGCGGGGGGGGATIPGAADTITFSGVAAKGPINGGNIKVYAVKNGNVDFGTVLGSGITSTDGSGRYSVTLNSAPIGPVVVEVSGGSYTDEASGTPAVGIQVPLRAVVSGVADGAKIAVTPLTNLAFEQVDGIGAFTTVEIAQYFERRHGIGCKAIRLTRRKAGGVGADLADAFGEGVAHVLARHIAGEGDGAVLGFFRRPDIGTNGWRGHLRDLEDEPLGSAIAMILLRPR